MDYPDVCLIFRKSRPGGNFSIEASFDTMLEAFKAQEGFSPTVVEVPTYSNGLWPRIQIARAVCRSRRAVNHITGDIHFAVLGLPKKGSILTVHDCGFMQHRNPLVRYLLWLFWLKLPIAHAQVVTAISESTKADLIKFTGCDPSKIRVIPTIIKNHFVARSKPFSAQKPRILHIGTAPNKNLLRHIEALQGIDCLLHIVGEISPAVEAHLNAFKIDYYNEWNLSDQEVRAAYYQSDLLLFASTLEGFGMPILEAQTVGRPVITSNISSMVEVAGNSACLVDPYSVESIRAGVLKVIGDARYREQLVAAGFKNILRFQPEAVARAYAELYEELSGDTIMKRKVKSEKRKVGVE
jgi:glycosyltransferase involved in cell wall biosynthesis